MKPVDPRLLRYAPAARGYAATAGAIAIAQTAAVLAFAWFLTDAITGVLAGRDVSGSLLALAGTVLARGALLWASDASGSAAAARAGSELRASLLAAIARKGPAWLAPRNRTSLAVIAGHGLDALDPYFARYLPQLALTVVATPVIVLVMALADWPSGLTAMLTLPLIPIFLILIGMATRTVQRRQLQTLQRLAARFADTVQGLSTLRLFGRDRRAVARIGETAENYRAETMTVLRYAFLSGFALELLSSLAVAVVAVAVGFRLLSGELALETGLFVLLLAPEAFLPLRQVGVQFHAAAEGVAATDELFDVLDDARAGERATRIAGAEHGAVEQDSAQVDSAPTPGHGSILRGHEVRVRAGERLLPPVSFEVVPGQITLVEGPSGAGKSRLLAALRGAAVYEGSVEFGGEDVSGLPPDRWLAWAGQRAGLMAGTIAENVALGSGEPEEARVVAVLREAAAGDLDPGTALGVQGAGLSGGQAQRVAVARALYRFDALSGRGQSPVLVLDEPSAALDAETEERLWQSLRVRADAGAGILLVSHRRSARQIADRTVVLGAER